MMNTNSCCKYLLPSVCIALLMGACAAADDDLVRCNQNPDFDTGCGAYNPRSEPEWKEAAVALPPLPRAENLRRIDAYEARKEYEYLVDRASIARGSDGVMRYTIVVRSAQGKANTFHEGIRCATKQVRTIAYASSDGQFRPSASVSWTPLAASGVRGYQAYLAHVIMCDRSGYDWDANKAIGALDGQFTAGGVRIEKSCLDLQRCGYYKRHDD